MLLPCIHSVMKVKTLLSLVTPVQRFICCPFYLKDSVDFFEVCCMDPDMQQHYNELLRIHQWKSDENNIKDELKQIVTNMK